MILQKFLRKIGAKSYLDLQPEERETYKIWENALSGRKLTDDDVETFLDDQLNDTLKKLPNKELNSQDDIFLKMKLQFIQDVKTFLKSPTIEKQMVEKQIEGLIDNLQ